MQIFDHKEILVDTMGRKHAEAPFCKHTGGMASFLSIQHESFLPRPMSRTLH